MTGRVRRRLVASLLAAALGTACGGGETFKDVHPSATEPREVAAPRPGSTTTAATTTTTTATHRDSEYDDVPPPQVIDRGNDRFAIARTLILYGRWLDWHHPDPALVTRAYLQGSKLARDIAADLANQRRARRRVIEVDDRPLSFRPLSALPNVFTLRFTEYLARRERVDVRGRVVESVGRRTEEYTVSVMRFGPDAPWRVNLIDRKARPIEIQL